MGFDPIQHAMCEDTAKQAAKSQRVGGVDKHRISVRMGDIDNADFNVDGIGFTKISPLMPTKEEIAKGTILCAGYAPNTGELIYTERLVVSEVLFDDGTVYGVRLDMIGSVTLTFPIYMAVAYRTGSWYDKEITETGTYLHVSGLEPEVRFTFEYETIHPIDPKFLPGVCLPVVELSTIPTNAPGTVLTAEESAMMEEVLTMGVPIVVKCYVEEGVSAIGICDFATPGLPMFVNYSVGFGVTKSNTGEWLFMLVEG